jgi:hypothetical protein
METVTPDCTDRRNALAGVYKGLFERPFVHAG